MEYSQTVHLSEKSDAIEVSRIWSKVAHYIKEILRFLNHDIMNTYREKERSREREREKEDVCMVIGIGTLVGAGQSDTM